MMVTMDLFLKGCAGFATICVAAGWLIKIINGLRKPKNDIDDKLQRDYDRINQLDEDMKEIRKTLTFLREGFNVQLENDKVILEHMRTNNSTGKIKEREDAIFDFLQEHQQ